MNMLKLVICFVLLLLCSGVYAFTLTFDDIPAEQSWDTYYFNLYDIHFKWFYLEDHANSSWGTPHSGNNVLVGCEGYFNLKKLIGPPYMNSVAAYFGTEMGAVIRMECYQNLLDTTPITCVDIGASGESWNNHYVEINSPVPFELVVFRNISSSYPMPKFCIDDLTIEPVPEPSSILALIGGIAGLGGFVLRRRK